MRHRAPPWAERLVGQTVGRRYRLDRLIGAGGTGAVYAATHEAVGRAVAVKVLSPALAMRPDVVERFRQEARAAAAFGGAGVVEVFDLDVEPGIGPYLVLEHLRGESLAERIARRQRLSVSETVELVSTLLATLGPVHARQIVHRDLKPDNVFFATGADGRETIKLLDFGIARVRDEALGRAMTSAGELLGTPHYMSAEQARGDGDLDHRTDLYAVGAIAYECLAGHPPFDGETIEILLVRVATQRPPPLSDARPDVPQPIVRWIDRAMQPSRDARFPDAATMRAELERAVDAAGIVTSHGSVAPPPASQTKPGVPGGITPDARSLPPTHIAAAPFPNAPHVRPIAAAPAPTTPARSSTGWIIAILALALGLPCITVAVIVAAGALVTVNTVTQGPTARRDVDPSTGVPRGTVSGPIIVYPRGALGLASGGPDALRERLAQARQLERDGNYDGAREAYRSVYLAAFAANEGPDTETSSVGAEALVSLGDMVARRINPVAAGIDGTVLSDAIDARTDILREAMGYYGTVQQLDSGRWAYCARVHDAQANQNLGDVIDAAIRLAPPGSTASSEVSQRNAFYRNARTGYQEALTSSAPDGAQTCRTDAAAASARLPPPP